MFRNQTSESVEGALTKRAGEIDGQGFVLSDLSDVRVELLDRMGVLQMDDCEGVTLLTGPIEGSFFMRNVVNSTIVVAAGQFRTRDCSNCDVYLYAGSDPVIEDSTDMRFHLYNLAYPGLDAHFAAASLDPSGNKWHAMYDFSNPDGNQGDGPDGKNFVMLDSLDKDAGWEVRVVGEGEGGVPVAPVGVLGGGSWGYGGGEVVLDDVKDSDVLVLDDSSSDDDDNDAGEGEGVDEGEDEGGDEGNFGVAVSAEPQGGEEENAVGGAVGGVGGEQADAADGEQADSADDVQEQTDDAADAVDAVDVVDDEQDVVKATDVFDTAFAPTEQVAVVEPEAKTESETNPFASMDAFTSASPQSAAVSDDAFISASPQPAAASSSSPSPFGAMGGGSPVEVRAAETRAVIQAEEESARAAKKEAQEAAKQYLQALAEERRQRQTTLQASLLETQSTLQNSDPQLDNDNPWVTVAHYALDGNPQRDPPRVRSLLLSLKTAPPSQH